MARAARRFHDRDDAGRVLGALCRAEAGPNAVVLGAPRGGVIVAARVAEALDAPLDVVLVRKLPLPFSPETAFGVIGEDGAAIVDEDLVRELRLDADTIERVKSEVLDALRRSAAIYRAARPAEPLRGRTVVLVDDGLATGLTMLGAVRWTRGREPARLVLAAPVASDTAQALLAPEVDAFVCPLVDPGFVGVSAYYEGFEPVDDEEVLERLRATG